MIRYNGKDITPRMGGKDLSRVMWNGLQIWSSSLTTLFTVYSDISGARVEYSSDNLQFSEVGVISGGNAKFEINDSDKENGFYIRLTGGVLPSEKATYTFNAQNLSISAEAYSGSINVTSVKSVTTYGMPSVTHVSAGEMSVTINAIGSTESGISVGYSPTNAIVIDENMTASVVTKQYTFTQDESGKQVTCTVTQAAGIRYSYTVNYNVPNAVVYAGGENVGTISSGSLTFYKWNSHAESSYSISFSGGLMPSAQSPTYSFSVSPTSLSFGENKSTQYVTVSSTKVTYTNVHNTGTVNRGSSVTIAYSTTQSSSSPSYSRSNSGTGISGSGTAITYAANPNTSQRSGTVTYTQDESYKTATVRCTQAARTLYSYTINSNCNGGTVYFNGTNKGTISNGKLTFTDTAASGTVSISGGVPSNSSSYVTNQTRTNGLDSESDTTTDSETVFEWNNWTWDYLESTGMDFMQSKDTNTWPLYSHVKSRTGTRYRYRDIYESRDQYRDTTYSAPSNQTAYGDGSAVTMNYTSSTSTRWTSWSFDHYGSWGSWGSWSYGSWSYSRKNVTITESLSWMTVSKTTYGSNGTTGYDISFTATENTGSNRSGYITFSNGINSYRVLVTQIGVEYVFRFSGSLGTHSANATTSASDLTECGGQCQLISYKKVGSTYTRLGVSFASGGNPSQVYDYWATPSTGTTTNLGWTYSISCKQSPYMGTSSNSRSYTVTMKQAESNKTASITIRQSDYALNIGGANTATYSIAYNSYSKNTNTGYKYVACQSGGNSSKWPNWIADSQTSWLALNDGKITATGSNGGYLYAKALSDNNSFSPRTGSFTLGIQGKTSSLGTYTFKVTQGAAPNEFYVKLSSGTGQYAFSRSNVTSLPHSSIIQYSVSTSARSINNLYILNTSLGAPFTSYAIQSFKVWRVSGNTATLYKTITVSPGGTVTI